MITRPGRSQIIGAASVFVGAVSLLVNYLVGGAMIVQLLKQWGYIPHGAAREPIEAWLIVTSAEALLSAVCAVFSIAIGAMTLRRSSRAAALHVVYARVKLPLACIFAACVGWGLPFYNVRDPTAIAAAVALALIASAAYPVLLLRTFGRGSEDSASATTPSGPHD